MLDGFAVVRALEQAGVTHVVWLPDSELGRWEPALAAAQQLRLVRVCREGEAFAIAAGLWLGGAKPVIVLQCTGLFEAGDALRNVIHDLKLPLFLIVGVRSLEAHRRGTSSDSCPVFTQPILDAWRIPYVLLEDGHAPDDLVRAYVQAQAEQRAGAVLIPE